MSAGRYDIVLESGATFDLPIHWVDSNASSVDMTSELSILRENIHE